MVAAVARTMQAYNRTSTVANLKDWQAAKKAFEEFQISMAADTDNPVYRGLSEVLVYLQSFGWKISKSKLYEDQRLIKKQSDGSMFKRDVDLYAERSLRRLDGSDADSDMSEKLEWEIEILKQKAAQLRRKNEIEEGMYVLTSEIEQQLSARAAFLKDSLTGFFQSMAARIVEKAEGNPDRTPDVIEFCLLELADIFNYYSKPLTVVEAMQKIDEETHADA